MKSQKITFRKVNGETVTRKISINKFKELYPDDNPRNEKKGLYFFYDTEAKKTKSARIENIIKIDK